jgi:cytochrome c oxidase cbb3-type subunit III
MAVAEPTPAVERPAWPAVLHEWVTTVDHKKIGLLYILMALLFLVIAGVEALVMRVQLLWPGFQAVPPDVFNQMFTMHGTTMVFFAGMPILAGVANYIVPLQLGARDMAFPRLNALGLWVTFFGGLLAYYSFATGGAPAIGWFAYAPLTERAAITMRLRPVLLACILLTGCDPPGKPNPADQEKWPDQVLDFDLLYRRNCAGCHGADGRWGAGPPLNDPLFLAIVPDEELGHVVAAGRPGTPMPAFARDQGGTLTAAQVRVLAEGLKPRWGAGDRPTKDAPAYAVNPGGRKDAGIKVFARACASCHGEHGEGTKSTGAINDPAFLALVSDQALRRYVITGRPDLGMPGYAGSTGRGSEFTPLTAPDISELVALLASWRQGKAAGAD